MNIASALAEWRVTRGESSVRVPVHASRSTEQGIALIIVMISIFVLTVLAGGFAYSMKVETKLASNGNSEEELQWLGRSGVEYARWVLANSMADPTQPYDSIDQPWATGSGFLGPTNAPIAEVQNPFSLGNGNVKWKITDLERKWNINALLQPGGQDILQNAFMNMGLDAGDMTPLINSILNWMDNGNRIQGAKSEEYQRMNPPYSAKNGPIDDLSELLLIKGITPEMYWGTSVGEHPPGVFTPREKRSHMPTDTPSFPVGLVDLFTPLSSGKININTATRSVPFPH
jgi:general secretion pathway protein K